MFYTFHQNNSGGSFIEPAAYVIIEASSYDEAEKIALDNGIYFNGVRRGIDCYCCGDRWYPAYSETEEPEVYGNKVTEAKFDLKDMYERDGVPTYMIVYKDGRRVLGSGS